jgi:hypothetical protein
MNNDMQQLLDLSRWEASVPTRSDLAALGLRAGGNWRSTPMQSFERSLDGWRVRERFVVEISFAVACREALEFIAAHSRKIVEVGAGTCFWSTQLARFGVDVIATDPGKKRYGHKVGAFGDVLHVTASEAVAKYPDRDLLSIWPCHGEAWLAEAAAKLKPGRLLFYIGEGPGGATADDSFHDMVNDETQFEPVDIFDMVQFWGLHDDLYVYRKT